MKYTLTILFYLFLLQDNYGQLFKKIRSNVKKDIEYKAERKVREKVDSGIDSITSPKNNKEKTQQTITTSSKNEVTQDEPQKSQAIPAESEEEGHITINLSSPYTTKGLPVTISGESIRHDKWKTIEIEFKAPDETTDKITVPLKDSGNYKIIYEGFIQEGEYIITGTSSNGKAKASKKLWVSDITQPDDGIKDLMEVTGEAFNRLKERGNRLKGMLSATHNSQLETKIAEVRNKYEAMKKFLVTLDATRKDISDLYKAGRIPSGNIRHHISQLNQMLAAKTEEIRQINKLADHEPSENTVCEYIVMLNEACAAFSTVTNFFALSISAILRNIMLDKVVPKATEVVIPKSVSANPVAGDEVTWGAKEATKIYATSKLDLKGFESILGGAEFAADLIQFATDVLLKKLCNTYKGTLTHSVDVYFRNEKGDTWWEYGYTTEAAFTLRYPKTNTGIIKMKGNIEGNATSFSFDADPMKNPDYIAGTAGKVQTIVIKNSTPISIDRASSLHDDMGFGMIARAVATPAYFNIPIDAEYNSETDKIKIFLNKALADFIPSIFNRQYLVQLVAGIPVLKMMDYPISNARLTINAALKEKSEFDIEKDSKGNPSFKAKVDRTIGTDDSPLQHILSVTISAKKE